MSNLSVKSTLPAQPLTPAAAKPAAATQDTAAAKVTETKLQGDSLELGAKKVSPIITISGGAFAGSMVGGLTGGAMLGLADIAFGKGESFVQAAQTGAGVGAVSGFVSGAVVANMTDSKWKATLYGALSGAGLGALSGGAVFKNPQAALVTGAVGAVSGAVSAFTTSKWLGN